MRHNSKSLSLRDPALALLVGAVQGDDFGGDYDFAGDFEFGDDDYGQDASPQAAQRAWQNQQAMTERRTRLLEPNKGSRVKVERYSFGMSQTLTLDTAVAVAIDQAPDTYIRPQRITCNSPVPGFVTLTDLKVANVSVIVGGTVDSFQYNANGVGQALDLPTLSPANRARAAGAYSGLTPTGYTATDPFIFVIGFTGPAQIVA